jgi:hypothetical protein
LFTDWTKGKKKRQEGRKQKEIKIRTMRKTEVKEEEK